MRRIISSIRVSTLPPNLVDTPWTFRLASTLSTITMQLWVILALISGDSLRGTYHERTLHLGHLPVCGHFLNMTLIPTRLPSSPTPKDHLSLYHPFQHPQGHLGCHCQCQECYYLRPSKLHVKIHRFHRKFVGIDPLKPSTSRKASSSSSSKSSALGNDKSQRELRCDPRLSYWISHMMTQSHRLYCKLTRKTAGVLRLWKGSCKR